VELADVDVRVVIRVAVEDLRTPDVVRAIHALDANLFVNALVALNTITALKMLSIQDDIISPANAVDADPAVPVAVAI